MEGQCMEQPRFQRERHESVIHDMSFVSERRSESVELPRFTIPEEEDEAGSGLPALDYPESSVVVYEDDASTDAPQQDDSDLYAHIHNDDSKANDTTVSTELNTADSHNKTNASGWPRQTEETSGISSEAQQGKSKPAAHLAIASVLLPSHAEELPQDARPCKPRLMPPPNPAYSTHLQPAPKRIAV